MQLDRKIIKFLVTEDKVLNYNYQYALMQEMYKLMAMVDKTRAQRVHNIGFEVDNKKYKLFNFHVYFEGAKYARGGIEIKQGSIVKLTISGVNQVLNLLFKGILKAGELKVDNCKLTLKSVDDDKKFRFSKIMLYKVRNPIVETTFNPKTKKAEFLNPCDMRYYEALGKNLLRKYEAIYNKKYEGELFFEIEDFCKIKQKFIKDINKDGFVIGFTNFELYIQADADMQKVAYNCGLGQNNSIGMGNISYICGRNE
ncbi:CRISPR-associated endoribonuclease Cas6 [uncultured Clostridium sp.]|jgi:CRISPR-associated endoribonuclease Cas6|uniref:CRISPR-associated endoribonuclease Cas6 n=1 Tax=uncultured Clostridium sp. TaxID=59620 RepID=UPI002614B801|nr:CRISPR-associated endoribonuclease Cas6 [uncultured Clostridium sp.]